MHHRILIASFSTIVYIFLHDNFDEGQLYASFLATSFRHTWLFCEGIANEITLLKKYPFSHALTCCLDDTKQERSNVSRSSTHKMTQISDLSPCLTETFLPFAQGINYTYSTYQHHLL